MRHNYFHITHAYTCLQATQWEYEGIRESVGKSTWKSVGKMNKLKIIEVIRKVIKKDNGYQVMLLKNGFSMH